MKVLLLNGNPRKEGNTFITLSEVAKTLENKGINTQIVSIGNKAVKVASHVTNAANWDIAFSKTNSITPSGKS